MRQWPPAAASISIAALLLAVPLSQWGMVDAREWALRGSRAATLTDPFFFALVVFRSIGAVLLGILLLTIRRPSAIWVTIVAVWMAGPPLTFFYGGIEVLAMSAGQQSLKQNWQMFALSTVFPLFITVWLTFPRRTREYYGFSTRHI